MSNRNNNNITIQNSQALKNSVFLLLFFSIPPHPLFLNNISVFEPRLFSKATLHVDIIIKSRYTISQELGGKILLLSI